MHLSEIDALRESQQSSNESEGDFPDVVDDTSSTSSLSITPLSSTSLSQPIANVHISFDSQTLRDHNEMISNRPGPKCSKRLRLGETSNAGQGEGILNNRLQALKHIKKNRIAHVKKLMRLKVNPSASSTKSSVSLESFTKIALTPQSEEIAPRASPVGQTKNLSNQPLLSQVTNIGNDHSNSAAPRRIRFNDPSNAGASGPDYRSPNVKNLGG